MDLLKPIRVADDFILDNIIQRFQNFTQRKIGKDCFFWAKFLCFLIAMIPFIIISVSSLREALPVSIYFCLLMLIFIGAIGVLERIVKEEIANKKTMNPFRNCLFIARIGFTIIFLFFWPDTFIMVMIAYFLSCTPLPPGESKARKWLNSLKKILSFKAPVPAEN